MGVDVDPKIAVINFIMYSSYISTFSLPLRSQHFQPSLVGKIMVPSHGTTTPVFGLLSSSWAEPQVTQHSLQRL